MQSATAMTTLQVSVSVEEPRREDWSELIREVERSGGRGWSGTQNVPPWEVFICLLIIAKAP